MAGLKDMGSAPVNVLVICTGNICRSPLAELLLRRKFDEQGLSGRFVVNSAGTYAEVGNPTHQNSLASAAKFGFDFSPVTARQLQPAMVEAADLVLTATTEHRGDVVRAVVSANRKTFTIKEFARVLEFLTGDLEHLEELDRGNIEAVDGVHALLAAASKYRGFTPPRQNSDDVVDPWGLSQEIYDSVTIELIDLTSKIAEKLGEAAK